MLFETAEVSHFRILAAEDVAVTTAYQAIADGSGPAHLPSTSREAKRWRLFPGNAAVTWDGIAVVNRGGVTTSVYVGQFDAMGGMIEEALISGSLDPESKALAVLSNLFSSTAGSYYEVYASQPLGLVRLRGDLMSRFLWENLAIPLE